MLVAMADETLPNLAAFQGLNYAYINVFVQDYSKSSVLAMGLLQFCTKPSTHFTVKPLV